MTVLPQVEAVVRDMHKAGKPIGALCIAPVIIAHVLKKVSVTFGKDEKINTIFQEIRNKGRQYRCPQHCH